MKTALFLLSAFLLSVPFATPADDEKQPPGVCCFEHPNYQGQCEVAPGEGETCESILEYLNTPSSVNKTYCGNTRIRGGWSLVACSSSTDEDPTSYFPSVFSVVTVF
jgi:hypothetical protein